MKNKIQAGWVIFTLLVISLALTACVKPYPGGEAAAEMPTVNPFATQPVIEPPVVVVTPEADQATSEPVQVVEPTPVTAEPTAEPGGETTYIVVAGDTLFKIALDNDVTVDEIAAANGIIDVNSLEVGQQLIIPAPGTAFAAEDIAPDQETVDSTEQSAEGEAASDSSAESDQAAEPAEPAEPAVAPGGIHVVQPGENLFRIGLKYGCSVEQLARHNGITTPNRISVGMQIEIPDCS